MIRICFFAISLTLIAPITLHAQDDSVDLEAVANSIVRRTNEFRQQSDLEPLSTNESLSNAATSFAKFMAETDKYGHQADGSTAAERAEAAGYSYCVVRENIAYRKDPTTLTASELAKFLTQGWIDSPSHRENMLADFVTQTGVHVATTDGTTFYAVQLFGRPESASYRVTVTNESDQTVSLKLVSNGASDTVELSPRMRLRSQRCFPITLRIEGAGVKEKVLGETDLKIVPGENEDLSFQKQQAPPQAQGEPDDRK